MNKLADQKIILITGTSKGIGYYLASYYIKKGFKVIGCSKSPSNYSHQNYHHFNLDISDEKNILEIFTFIRREYKRLDFLINNAAINPAILSAALLPYNTIEKTFKTNILAPMVFCREAVKLMVREKFGRIINIGSMATKHEVSGESLYTTTKAALNAYTRVLAKEVATSGITVNVVAPSAIKTELSSKINQMALQDLLSRNAIHEFGDMPDISNLIDLILKPESASITGQIIYLGGA
jgi:3-oxoacyl-[acyl-carrier protein] reductase